MSKKLEKNGMWESSRMMLPEHREAILKDDRSLKLLVKPELDEQEVALIDQAIGFALRSNCTIILTVFNKYELQTITGRVLMLKGVLRMVKIILEDPSASVDECLWISMRDIIKAEVREVEEWDEGEIDYL
jgi:hypothetical protein